MVLLAEAVPGSRVTQRFGKAVASVAHLEPAMWATVDRAYWIAFAGAKYFPSFHPGIDKSAPEGTPVYAREAGKVLIAGYYNSTSGNVVRVEIRPDVSRYGFNHLRDVSVRPGVRVVKGQLLGHIGHTGSNTGNSTHHSLEIKEFGIGWVCHNPELFEPGGSKANDARIVPIGGPAPVPDLAVLKGPGINIRTTADLDVGVDNLYATSRQTGVQGWKLPSGIWRAGKRIHTNIYTGFIYRRTLTAPDNDGVWVECYGFGRVLFISRPLVNIIVR